MEFIRSSVLKDHASATEVIEKDLPTGPLSHLILSVVCNQDTNEITLAELIAFINKIEVTQKGVAILSAESEDLYGQNCYLFRRPPIKTNNITTATATTVLGLIIPFGRKIFNPDECFPATKKGDLTLRVDTTAIATSAITGFYNIEAVELVGASPSHYLKTTMMTVAAPGATGDNDVDLPIGNDIVAIQIRRTSGPVATGHAYGVNAVSILKNNKQFGYASATMECMEADKIFRLGGLPSTMLLQQLLVPPMITWMDFDPNDDDKWLLDTKDATSLKLRLDMGVNEATYLTLLERVAV